MTASGCNSCTDRMVATARAARPCLSATLTERGSSPARFKSVSTTRFPSVESDAQTMDRRPFIHGREAVFPAVIAGEGAAGPAEQGHARINQVDFDMRKPKTLEQATNPARPAPGMFD